MPYAMTPERMRIKQLLIDLQSDLQRGNWVVRCELCGKSHSGLDLHELFLDKGDVQGCPEEIYKLVHETELNLQLLCNQCNMVHAKTQWGRAFLFRKKLDQLGQRLPGSRDEQACVERGAEEVVTWIRALGLKDPEPYVFRVLAAAAPPTPVRGVEV